MIPVSTPYIARNSLKYVTDAIEAGAISGLFGEHLPIFETAFAEFVGVKHAVSCANGTIAIHLPLAARGIGPGDEVLVSSLTNMATFFAVMYCGATPVPVDIDLDTFNMSVIDAARKVTSRTKGILVVHLFGQPADMTGLQDLADAHGLDIFEDCAESHGATLDGIQTGAFGLAGCFSFFANKVLNTGEGGMVTTNNDQLAAKMRSMRSLSFGKTNKFIHEGIGFNYRMDNVKAALGRAQMEEAPEIVSQKIETCAYYDQLLAGENNVVLPARRQNAVNVYWMYHLRLADRVADRRDEVMRRLNEAGIETRPGFVSYTLQTFGDRGVIDANPCPVAEKVSFSTFYLPTAQTIDKSTQEFVVGKLREILVSL